MFFYHERPIVRLIDPIYVSSNGGAVITIEGEHFQQTSSLIVRLVKEGQSLNLQVISNLENIIKAIVGPNSFGSDSIQAEVQVSNNGFDYSNNGPSIRYESKPVISSMTPSVFPTTGRISVLTKIVNAVLIEDALVIVKYGDVATNCSIVTVDTVTCVVPPHFPDSVTVAVSINGGLEFYGSNLKATYVEPYSVLDLMPKQGPISLFLDP